MIHKELYTSDHLNPMMPVYILIRTYIQGLTTKKITKAFKADLFEIINAHGTHAEKFMFLCLLQSLDLKEVKEKGQTSPKVTFLNQALSDLSSRDNFIYYFSQVLVSSVRNPLEYVQALIKYLKLQMVTQIILALSLYLSENPAVSKEGYTFLKTRLIEYYQLGKPVLFPPKILEELLFQIGRNPQLHAELQESYQYLLDTNTPDKVPEAKHYHFLNQNSRIYSYDPPLITKTADIIKKAEILRDLGPIATYNIDQLKTMLTECGPLTEEDVFECLMVMSEEESALQNSVDKAMSDLMVANKKNSKDEWKKVNTSQEAADQTIKAHWNIDNFLTYAVQNVPNLKWTSVIGYFDRLNLKFKSPKAFASMFKFFQKAKKQGPKYKTPEVLFFKRWNHPRSQLEFLLHVFKCDEPDVFALNEVNGKKIVKCMADSLKSTQNIQSIQMWAFTDLVQMLVELSDYDFMAVRDLLDIPIQSIPEVLLQTLSEIHFTRGEAMLNEIYSQLFPVYLSNHTSHITLLTTLWETNEDLVISAICELYKKENKKDNSCLNLSKVLDITQSIREALIPLSNWNDYQFSVALGVLAGKREFLHFEHWVKERLKNIGTPFLLAIMGYVEESFLKQTRDLSVKFGSSNPSFHQSIDLQLEKAQLSRELLAFVYESALQFQSNKFSVRAVEMMKKQYMEVCGYFPEMTDNQVVDEIEIMAEKNFSRIYKEEISLEDAIQMMFRLKNSTRQDERELYASMITYLFTELRFHSNYPEKELMITANFFSAIINAKFIEKKLFTVFILVLAEDLKFNDRRYDFAVTVIDKIKDRLVEEPSFVEELLDREPLVAKNPELITALLEKFNPPLQVQTDKLAALKASMDTKFAPPPVVEPPSVMQPERSIEVTDTDTDLLEVEERISKSGPNIGKLTLACNTLSMQSINDKIKELTKWLDSKELVRWFSFHLVYKRITNCTQPSMFDVYCSLISNLPLIEKPVVNLTYRVMQKWFSLSGKSVNDKKLKAFKNLGTWLGRITIGRKEPLLIHKINLKEIIIRSYSEKLRLQQNIEVITKIIENKKYSPDVFSLKNPWLGPIFGVLKELNGKLNDSQVKGEIQRLFRNSNVPEGDIETTNYLSYTIDKTTLTIAELPNYVYINQEEFKQYIDRGLDVRKIVAQAVDAAIQQIVPPVISRSVTIALVTTKQLALKDFMFEPDHQKLEKGTHYIVQNLSGSLALVTCREPLKMSLSTFLKKKLEEYTFLSESEKEQIVTAAARDNLDLGCALIKKAVVEKALQEIDRDPVIVEQIQKRKEAKTNKEIFKNEPFYTEIAQFIPEQLRPRAGGLSEEEFRIYEDFQRDKRAQPTAAAFKKSENLSPKEIVDKMDKVIAMVEENRGLQNISQYLSRQENFNYTELAQRLILFLFEHSETQLQCSAVLQLIKEHINGSEIHRFFMDNIPQHQKLYERVRHELTICGLFPSAPEAEFCKKVSISIFEDPEYEAKTRTLLDQWVNCCTKEIEEYLIALSNRFTRGEEEEIKKFFYFTVCYSVEECLKSRNPTSEVLNYQYIDEESKLIVVGLKIVSSNRSVYLDHISESIVMAISKFHDQDLKPFNQRPFFRLILNIIYDISRKSYKFDENIVLTTYTVLSSMMHKLQPLEYPGFSFAWLELVSNKYFMPTILENYHYWDLYHQLLVDLLKFARSKLTVDTLSSNSHFREYYKGILRLVTILLHDFPDFLSEFSFSLANETSDTFIQIRNIILSAFPQSLEFPEPQTIQIKQLGGISNISKLPKYYKTKLDKTFNILGVYKSQEKLAALKTKLSTQSNTDINMFVLFCGLNIYECTNDPKQIELFEDQVARLVIWLVTNSEAATKHKLFRGMLNLIRFPNALTFLWIKVVDRILYEEDNPLVQSTLVKAIIERMKMEKPHPWGLILVTNEMKGKKKKLSHLGLKEISEL